MSAEASLSSNGRLISNCGEVCLKQTLASCDELGSLMLQGYEKTGLINKPVYILEIVRIILLLESNLALNGEARRSVFVARVLTNKVNAIGKM